MRHLIFSYFTFLPIIVNSQVAPGGLEALTITESANGSKITHYR